MTDATIFTPTSADAVSQQTIPPVSSPVLPPEVAELVGQGKKYSSVDEALKSVPHAQKHIRTLEEELAQAKVELEKRRTAEQLLDEIKSGLKPVEQPSTSSISSDSIEKIVEQQLEKQRQVQSASANISKVTTAFSTKFGDKAEEVYNSLAKDSGLTIAMMNQLAATSPTAILKLAGLTVQEQISVGKPSSSVNTSAMQSSTDNSQLSSRVKAGASTKDLVSAWKIAGQKVNKPQ